MKVALAVLKNENGQVLIGKRADGEPPWSFPGHDMVLETFDPDYVLDQADLALEDETGLTADANSVIGYREHPATKAMCYYVAMGKPINNKLKPGGSLTEVKWVKLVEALRLMPDMYGPVKQYLGLG